MHFPGLKPYGSPIEESLGAELIAWLEGPMGDEVYLANQFKIGLYRVDFFIKAYGQNLAIECDGHDFHDRTKEQAARDRQRDRMLLSCGCHTVRFTGSEIYANATGCAFEVFELLDFFRESEGAK
jgi:very-short-patch-repair endonuclease